jgi:cytoplasmic iron level regulating protein YaaA (DUF328/UPF0246 family)
LATSLRILVPLSDRKKPGGREGAALGTARPSTLWSFRSLNPARRKALAAFRAAMSQQTSALKVLGLKAEAFREAYAVNRAFDRSRLTSALERCNGTFAEALRHAELAAVERRRIEARVLFVCPLFGVLAPEDRVPDFRCPEGAKLPEVGSLHRHWKPEVTKFLNRVLKGKHVISFLPTRLGALWEPDGAAASVTVVRFGRRGPGGRPRGETAAAPGLCGEALRFVVEDDVQTPAEFFTFASSLGHVHAPAFTSDEDGFRVQWFMR